MTKSLSSPHKAAPADAATFTPDWNLYEAVSRAARLVDIKLAGSTYAVRPEILSMSEDVENMELRYGGECIHYQFDAIEGMAIGTFRWSAEAKLGRKSCLKIRSEYLLVYVGLNDHDSDHVNFFFKKVGRFASYPYFRSHFSHHTSETGLIFPPLPILHERVD